jgi:predicted DNA-binding transcriptional regulator AlpA
MPMKIADISKRYGIPERSLYRWMDEHPNLAARDPDSMLGHPFPQPVGKEGRANVWDEEEVSKWWGDNCKTLGRHPVESPTIVMKYDDYRRAWETAPERWTDDKGVEHVEDHMLKVEYVDQSKVQTQGDVRLTFRSASDAVWFRLRF